MEPNKVEETFEIQRDEEGNVTFVLPAYARGAWHEEYKEVHRAYASSRTGHHPRTRMSR